MRGSDAAVATRCEALIAELGASRAGADPVRERLLFGSGRQLVLAVKAVLKALPNASTAAQTVVVGHEIEVGSPRYGSTRVLDDHPVAAS